MAVFGQSAAKWFIALLACMLLVVTAVSSPAWEDAEERVTESFADAVPTDIWLLNDSLKALVERTQ